MSEQPTRARRLLKTAPNSLQVLIRVVWGWFITMVPINQNIWFQYVTTVIKVSNLVLAYITTVFKFFKKSQITLPAEPNGSLPVLS
jgi:hypothetical protein